MRQLGGSEPVFGALFAWLWLGEAMGPLRWVGGGLMAVAAVMVAGTSASEPASVTSPES